MRKGQSTLLMLAILGFSIGIFAWVSIRSIQNRHKEISSVLRKVSVKNQELALQNMLSSPEYLNKAFWLNNQYHVSHWIMPELIEIEKKLKSENRKPAHVFGQTNLEIKTIRFPEAEVDELGAAGMMFGAGTRHNKNTLEPCSLKEAEIHPQLCSLESVVEIYKQFKDRILLRVKFELKDSSASFIWNKDKEENIIEVTLPLHLFGIQFESENMFCKPGFQLFALGEAPGEFLCKIIK